MRKQAPIAAGVNLVNSVLTALVFWDRAPHLFLVLWVVAIWATSLSRFLRLAVRPSDSSRPSGTKRAIHQAVIITGGCGALWGLAGFVLFPYGTPVYQLFLTLVIGGMAAGVVAAFSCLPAACYGFIVPAGVPLALRFAFEGDAMLTIIAAISVLFLAVLSAFARNAHQSFRDGVESQRENDKLMRQIAEAHELLADAIDNSPGAMALYDSGDRLIAWNKNFQKFFFPRSRSILSTGVTFETLVRTHAKHRRAKDPSFDEEDLIKRRLASHRRPGKAMEYQLSNGRWVQTIDHVTDSGGRVSIHTDITKLKKRESDYADKSALLESILGNMDQGLVALGPGMTVLAANRRAAQILGVSAKMLAPGTAMTKVMRLVARHSTDGAEDPNALVGRATNLIERGRPLKTYMRWPKGRVVEIRGTPSTENCYVLMVTDITRQSLGRTAREGRSKVLEKLTGQSSLGEVLTALAETIDAVNVNVCASVLLRDGNTGRMRLGSEPKQCDFFVSSDIGPDVTEESGPWGEAARSGRRIVYTDLADFEEWDPYRELTESAGVAAYWSEPIPSSSNDVLGALAICSHVPRTPTQADIEFIKMSARLAGIAIERKRAQDALYAAKDEAEQANRAKSQFLANMSHELRTPLNAIDGFAQLILREPYGSLGDSRYADYASYIRDSSRHLLGIISDILDLSKVEADRLDLDESVFEVGAMIRTSVQMIEDMAKESDLRVILSSEIDCLRLRADERLIKQILVNLLSNAVKFTPAGGTIELRTELDGEGRLVFSVIDTGLGIADKDKDVAFSPFGQIGNALERKYQGTGLGLPLARSLVDLHGGWLEIDSEVGAGTTARVLLPAERVLAANGTVEPLRAGAAQ